MHLVILSQLFLRLENTRFNLLENIIKQMKNRWKIPSNKILSEGGHENVIGWHNNKCKSYTFVQPYSSTTYDNEKMSNSLSILETKNPVQKWPRYKCKCRIEFLHSIPYMTTILISNIYPLKRENIRKRLCDWPSCLLMYIGGKIFHTLALVLT